MHKIMIVTILSVLPQLSPFSCRYLGRYLCLDAQDNNGHCISVLLISSSLLILQPHHKGDKAQHHNEWTFFMGRM